MKSKTKILVKNFIASKNDGLVNLECFENYNEESVNNIKKLLKSEILMESEYEIKGNIIKYNEREILEKMLKKIKNNKLKVKYIRKKNYGRIFTYDGLNNLRCEIRQTLAIPSKYIDLDIVNCCYSIMKVLSEYYETKNDGIINYIENRETILNKMSEKMGIEKKLCKLLFIRIGFGGKIKSWLRDFKIEEIDEDIKELLNNIKIEIAELENAILVKEDNFVKIMEENKKSKNKFLPNFIFDLEVKILEIAYLFLTEKKIIKNDCVLIYDGLMIREFEDINYSNLLKELNKEIYEKSGFKLKFEIKEQNKNCIDLIKDIEINNIEINDLKIDSLSESDKNLIPFKNFSHSDGARIFYSKHTDDYIFSNNSGWWFYLPNNILYNSKTPPTGIINKITEYLREYIKKENSKFTPINPNFLEIQKNYCKIYKELGNSKFIEGIIKYLAGSFLIYDFDQKIDADMNLFCFNNCLYDYSIKSIREIRRGDYISKTTKYDLVNKSNISIRNELNIFFNSLFVIDKKDEKTLTDEEINNQNLLIEKGNKNVKYFLNILATSLIFNNLQSIYIFTGVGGNGKSLVLQLIKAALGSYFIQTEPTFLTQKAKNGSLNPTLYDCKGKRFVACAEPDTGEDICTFNVDFIKAITGKDSILTRTLYFGNIEFESTFTPFLLCNEKPQLKKIDNGIIRRLKILEFPFKFVNNPKLPDEKQGNITLDKTLRKQEYVNEFILLLFDIVNELNFKKIPFEEPDEVKNSINEYISENNPVQPFLDENYILINKNNNIKEYNKNKIKAKELFRDFKTFNYKTNVTERKFNQLMEQCRIECHKYNDGLYFIGIKKNIDIIE